MLRSLKLCTRQRLPSAARLPMEVLWLRFHRWLRCLLRLSWLLSLLVTKLRLRCLSCLDRAHQRPCKMLRMRRCYLHFLVPWLQLLLLRRLVRRMDLVVQLQRCPHHWRKLLPRALHRQHQLDRLVDLPDSKLCGAFPSVLLRVHHRRRRCRDRSR